MFYGVYRLMMDRHSFGFDGNLSESQSKISARSSASGTVENPGTAEFESENTAVSQRDRTDASTGARDHRSESKAA